MSTRPGSGAHEKRRGACGLDFAAQVTADEKGAPSFPDAAKKQEI
ncbi:MAG: hypothetical protein R3C42_00265 [Parvularculaceae bacterium]